MTPIYIPWNQNFGDIYATLNLLLHRAFYLDEPVYLSRWQNDTDLKPMMQDILRLLSGAPTHLLIISDEKGNTKLSGYDVWATPYFQARKTWFSFERHPFYAYQLDGVSSPELKNPPPADISKIKRFLGDGLLAGAPAGLWNLPAIKLGLPMRAESSAAALAGCMFFVGVDSGMSHLAHSVGCPIFLLEYQLPVVTCHRGKAYTLCEGADDFIIKIQRYRDMLFTTGHPDGVRSELAR